MTMIDARFQKRKFDEFQRQHEDIARQIKDYIENNSEVVAVRFEVSETVDLMIIGNACGRYTGLIKYSEVAAG